MISPRVLGEIVGAMTKAASLVSTSPPRAISRALSMASGVSIIAQMRILCRR